LSLLKLSSKKSRASSVPRLKNEQLQIEAGSNNILCSPLGISTFLIFSYFMFNVTYNHVQGTPNIFHENSTTVFKHIVQGIESGVKYSSASLKTLSGLPSEIYKKTIELDKSAQSNFGFGSQTLINLFYDAVADKLEPLKDYEYNTRLLATSEVNSQNYLQASAQLLTLKATLIPYFAETAKSVGILGGSVSLILLFCLKFGQWAIPALISVFYLFTIKPLILAGLVVLSILSKLRKLLSLVCPEYSEKSEHISKEVTKITKEIIGSQKKTSQQKSSKLHVSKEEEKTIEKDMRNTLVLVKKNEKSSSKTTPKSIPKLTSSQIVEFKKSLGKQSTLTISNQQQEKIVEHFKENFVLV
jgi:hypothetical protein